MGKKQINIKGETYGRLKALYKDDLKSTSKNCFWYFQCDCGVIISANKGNVRFGNTRSCGCLHKEQASISLRISGLSTHHLFGTWKAMIDRCYNESNTNYKYYGGRGISICDRWLEVQDHKGFINFLSDMGEKPEKSYTIDRKNTNGDYEPSNCRWASKNEQAINTRIRTDNSSGVKGVRFCKLQQKWFAELAHNKIRYRSKPFNDFESAKQWRIEKEKEIII